MSGYHHKAVATPDTRHKLPYFIFNARLPEPLLSTIHEHRSGRRWRPNSAGSPPTNAREIDRRLITLCQLYGEPNPNQPAKANKQHTFSTCWPRRPNYTWISQPAPPAQAKGKIENPAPREKHHKTQIETISNRTALRKRKFISSERASIAAKHTSAVVCVYWLPGRQICGLFQRAPLARDKKGFIGLHRLTAFYWNLNASWSAACDRFLGEHTCVCARAFCVVWKEVILSSVHFFPVGGIFSARFARWVVGHSRWWIRRARASPALKRFANARDCIAALHLWMRDVCWRSPVSYLAESFFVCMDSSWKCGIQKKQGWEWISA